MNDIYMEGLTEKEWKLLQLLATYGSPFYIDDAYERFNLLESDELEFYILFFRIQFDGYIRMLHNNITENIFTLYMLTSNGKTALQMHTARGNS